MIQRIQSLLFLFSTICVLIIVFLLPVLHDETSSYLLKDNFPYARLCLLMSALISFFAIFQFKNRKRQQLLASFARLMITISFFVIVFFHSKEKIFGLGMLLMIIPFITLIGANFFINKDEKLVKSADRIR